MVVREEAKKLAKGEGKITIIIVLSHCGLDVDKKIAEESGEYIDVIVGGHSHSFMYTEKDDEPVPGVEHIQDTYPAVVVPKQHPDRKVLIVQAQAWSRFLGDLVVDFDNSGEVVGWKGNPIYLDSHFPEGNCH